MEIQKFGTLYYGGFPAPPDAPYTTYFDSIAICHSVRKKEISWVKVGNLFVSTKVIAPKVSLDNLNRSGLVYGAPVFVDGNRYLCRSLSVGRLDEDASEWTYIIDACGGEKKCEGLFQKEWFWGQEKALSSKTAHIIAGYDSLKTKSLANNDARTSLYGFRPVLEPMDSDFDSIVTDALIGKMLSICGHRGRITGILNGISDYDLQLSCHNVSGLPEDFSGWAFLQGDNIVVSRRDVWFMRIERGDNYG